MAQQYLRERDQAALLKVSLTTLRDWRRSKIVPFFKIGRLVLYNPEAVTKALEKFERKAVAQ